MSKGYYKPDGSLFVLAGANKMEGGANNGTLWYSQFQLTLNTDSVA